MRVGASALAKGGTGTTGPPSLSPSPDLIAAPHRMRIFAFAFACGIPTLGYTHMPHAGCSHWTCIGPRLARPHEDPVQRGIWHCTRESRPNRALWRRTEARKVVHAKTIRTESSFPQFSKRVWRTRSSIEQSPHENNRCRAGTGTERSFRTLHPVLYSCS